MKNLYLFSGLGADKRAFKNLDFSGYNTTFIEWVEPEKKETLEQYAKRLTNQITDENPVLIGLSFGGIIAIEVSKHIKTEKIIIISSIKTRSEAPKYYRWIGLLGMHKLPPSKFYKKQNAITNKMFGVESKSDKETLAEILKDTNVRFLKWAMDSMFKWKNISLIENLTHIHGTKDKILPIKYTKPNIVVENGGHLMILNKAEEVSRVIRELV